MWVSVRVCLCVYLCLCVYVSLSLYVSLCMCVSLTRRNTFFLQVLHLSQATDIWVALRPRLKQLSQNKQSEKTGEWPDSKLEARHLTPGYAFSSEASTEFVRCHKPKSSLFDVFYIHSLRSQGARR